MPPLNQTCVQCAQSKVRCDKKIPCGRCCRRGTICTSQPRKRGRSARDEQTPPVAAGWVNEEEYRTPEEEKRGTHVKLERPMLANNGYEHIPPGPVVFEPPPTASHFLTLVYSWLSQEPVSTNETWRAAIVMQSFIQASLNNAECLDLVMHICKVLNIDGSECLRWCRARIDKASLEASIAFEIFVMDVSLMKLPPYIQEFVQTDTDIFIYSYHNGQETYASSSSWDGNYSSAGDLYEQCCDSSGVVLTFLDVLAVSVITPVDRRDFLAKSADLIIKGKSSREERSCILICGVNNDGVGAFPCLVNLRLWSDTGTDSFTFVMKVVRLPKSKYIHLNNLKRSKDLGGQKESDSYSLIESTQRLVERKKWDSRWKAERDLLSEEQLIAAMLPLDEVLELDELDIEAVAEYLHG